MKEQEIETRKFSEEDFVLAVFKREWKPIEEKK